MELDFAVIKDKAGYSSVDVVKRHENMCCTRK